MQRGGWAGQTSRAARGVYPAGLSRREVEVLALVAHGLTDGEVAEETGAQSQDGQRGPDLHLQ